MSTKQANDLLLYDGDCGVCDDGMSRMRRRLNPPVDIRSYQNIDLEALGVSLDVVTNEGPVLVRTKGDQLVGPAAIAAVMRASGAPYTLVGAVMSAPGVRRVLAWAGPKLYRQRYRFPGAGRTCKAPASA